MNPKLFHSIDPIMIWRFDESPRLFQEMFQLNDNMLADWLLYVPKPYIKECYDCFYGGCDVLDTKEFRDGEVIALGYFSC